MKGLDFFIKKTVICVLGGGLVLSLCESPSFGQSESDPSEDRVCIFEIETLLSGIAERPGKLRARLSFEEGLVGTEAELYFYGTPFRGISVISGTQVAGGRFLFEGDFGEEDRWFPGGGAILKYTRPDGKKVSAYVELYHGYSHTTGEEIGPLYLASTDFTEEVEWTERLFVKGAGANFIDDNDPFLSELRNERGVLFLVFSLDHGRSANVRRAAARILHEVGPAAPSVAAPALARELRDPELPTGDRGGAIHALGRMGPAAGTIAIPALIEALRDSDFGIRLSAAYTLGAIGPSAGNVVVIPALIEALRDSNSGVRLNAVGALVRMGASAVNAIPALNTVALTDPDPDVRNSAGRAIVTIRDEEKKQSQGQKSLRRRPKKSGIFIETFDCKEDIADPRCKRPQMR